MKNKIQKLIENKKVLILGFGKEGRSTYKYLKKLNNYSSLCIADGKEDLDDLPNEQFVGGENYQSIIDDYDIVFKSPGVELEKSVSEYKAVITTQIDEFMESYNKQIVGITGTKGKSTTTSIIYHVLKECNKDVIICGNIGFPVFDIEDKITNNTIIVLELSSYQLETIKKSPKTAIFLNLYEDHLQRYHTIDKYFAAKANIYKYQKEEDILLVGKNVENRINKNNKTVISEDYIPKLVKEKYDNIKLKGDNNLMNIAFAFEIVKKYDITEENFYRALLTFCPLPHRLEFIKKVNDVEYYDDSISTTVESAINAVNSIPNTKTILLGGVDRGIDYTLLVDFVKNSKLENVLVMYASGEKIYKILKTANINKNIILFKDLKEATAWALKNCEKNTACILSPASASHGYFKNFEDRGDYFQNIIKNY